MYKRAYAYLRVSTFQQVDGQSLTGQEEEIKQYCAAYGIELVRVYSDEGKSGKNIVGRPQFQKMLQDVEEKQEVDCVIVWKLSRFGRNACDSLNSLTALEKHGVSLIALKENLDTGNHMGKLVFTLLAALAEMERENIREQTTNGKKYTALAGGWNGGMAPYGYTIEDGVLAVNEEEAAVVRKIYEWFLESEDAGYSTVTARLNETGIKPRQIKRLDRKAMEIAETDEEIYLPVMDDWYTTIVKKILDNPVYCGKIRYGYYRIETLEDGRMKRHYSDNPVICEGKHEAIIPEEMWNQVKEKREKHKKPHGRLDSTCETVNNVFNRVAKCPQCGGNMIAYASAYTNVKGLKKKYYQYVCGYWNNHKKENAKRIPSRRTFGRYRSGCPSGVCEPP